MLKIPAIRQDLVNGISSFSCTKNQDLETFLKENSFHYEEIAKSRSYLLIDEESLGGTLSILAYFSIGMKTLLIPEDLSARQLRQLDGYSDKMYKRRITSLPVYLIGQLAKNERFARNIDGDEIIQAAISVIRNIQRSLGGRLIAVDCKPIKALHDFYERNQFIMIGHNEDNDLDQFVYFLNRKRLDFGRIVDF